MTNRLFCAQPLAKIRKVFFHAIFCLIFLCLSAGSCAIAQVLINEGSNLNYRAIMDENGDYPDWIELYNAGSDSADLYNYSLTDNPQQVQKWVFPHYILPPGGHKVVFCSDKNRKPKHAFVHVLRENNYRADTGWNRHVFNRPVWWDGSSSLLINICFSNPGWTSNAVFRQSETAYLSTIFAVRDAANSVCVAENGYTASLRPNIRLNNITIGSGNYQNSPTDYPAPYGNWYSAGRHQMIIPVSELTAAGLSPGNIHELSFHIASADSQTVYHYLDFFIRPVSYSAVSDAFEPLDTLQNLHSNFKISGSGETIYLYRPDQTLVSSLLVKCGQPDQSNGFQPDGNQAGGNKKFMKASPGKSNNANSTFSVELLAPVLMLPSGFFSSTVFAGISNTNGPESKIRYTLNGKDPDSSSQLYSGNPIPIYFSRVLKARAFAPGSPPGPVSAATYLFGVSHSTPVLSLITDQKNLYGEEGIFDNWQFDWERDAFVEYFNSNHQKIFSRRAGIQMDGGLGGSRTQPQRSFRIEMDHSVLGSGTVYYPLIPNRSGREKYGKLYLRNGSNYFLSYPFKDAALLEISGAETQNYYTAWRPVSVYINGSYHGLYELREKMDAEYFEENDGADGNKIDYLSMSAWNFNALRAIEGSADSFHLAFQDFSQLNPADTGFYRMADKKFDLKYYADYIAAETWAGNIDWPHNNIKIYRSDKTGYRWRFCLTDLEGSMNPGGFSTASDDHISYALNGHTGIPYIRIFQNCIQNPDFRKYFINRYADLMNSTFRISRIHAVPESMFSQTVTEMPKTYQRWGDPNDIPGQMANFENNHQIFLSELSIRNEVVREDINQNFGLNGQVEVGLDVFPPGAGKIKISTITPDSLPWTGIYFNGNPVRLTAVPNPGFEFVAWDSNSILPDQDTSASFERNISSSDLFRAVFSDISAILPRTESTAFSIYPNPSSECFTVHCRDFPSEVVISNAQGREIHRSIAENRRARICLPQSGIYSVRVTHKGNSSTKKLAISH